MRLIPTKCPNCGAAIEIDVDNDKYMCKYCRQTFVDADFKRTYNVNENINRTIDETEIKKQETKQISLLVALLIMVIALIFAGIIF